MEFTRHIETLLATKSQASQLKKIGFIEGWSKRMIASALSLKKDGLLEPIMLFPTVAKYKESNLPPELKYLIIENETKLLQELTKFYEKKRSGKETFVQIKVALATTPYFAGVLVDTGKIAGAIGGVQYASSDILRAGFKTIGAQSDVKTISSVMILHKANDAYVFTDISVNVDPTTEQLVEIAHNASRFAKSIALDQTLAFLSFSTAGSAITSQTSKIQRATKMFNDKIDSNEKALGEIQFDAAYDQAIRKQKYPGQTFKKRPTIFVFPDLNAGNIGYKIAQRMGQWGAIGPILTGIAKPFNDLSRGAKVSDIKYTAVLTALQSF